MKNSCIRYAMAAFAATSLLITTASAAFSGAIYTSLGNGTTVNANTYEDCELVFLNGGPQNLTGSGIPDGIYLFEVTNPSTSDLLSTDPAKNRQVKVINGRIYGTPGQVSGDGPADVYVAPLFGAADGDMHALGSYNPTNQSIPVQLWEFDPTTNSGGVYKVTLYSVAGGATPDPENEMAILSPGGNSKSDNFRCVHDDGGPGENEVIVFGRKYYDANANGVYDGGEEWTTADGRPPVTINLTWAGGPASVETDADGLWFYLFTVADGATLSFTACEEVPTDYNQTGPLDDDSVTNPDPLPVDPAPYASATAAGGCWYGTITDTLGLINLNFGNVDTVTIGGVKFYDANVNGVNDGEEGIPGFKIVLEITYPDDTTDTVEVWTGAGGAWTYDLPVGSSVTACEVMPSGTWMQTYPSDNAGCHVDVVADAGTPSLDFGNVCLGAGGGKTLGYWSNKNGQATMNDGGSMVPELTLLNGLCLRNATGVDQTFVLTGSGGANGYKEFRTWILNATATNMAYMLSAQFAAMKLNVEAYNAGPPSVFVNPASIVYAPDCGNSGLDNNFISIADLIAAAESSVCSDGLTVAASTTRSDQECLKNALDNANNNLNFVQATPCAVVYPE